MSKITYFILLLGIFIYGVQTLVIVLILLFIIIDIP